ncbi:MAG: DEAD/DEAH box helicase family protein [Gammaproteobacteria bacterium]
MAKARRQARVQRLIAQKDFHKKLVLNQWLLTSFGLDPLQKYRDQGERVRPLSLLSKSLRALSGQIDASGQHAYLFALLEQWQPDWRYSEQDLRQFDANIVAHTQTLNALRDEKIQWKYFQWLTLLFVEIYLHEYFRDRTALSQSLNKYIERFNAHWLSKGYETGIEAYIETDLNKLCLQNATGSGKTLLMHINMLQFRHYADRAGCADQFGQMILITPNERLSEQHQLELRQNGLDSERLTQDEGDLLSGDRRSLARLAVTEITKLGAEQGKKTMAVNSFGDANLLLVDEGHRGLGSAKEESGWLWHRQKLAGAGFTFEYSATFKEAVVAAKNDLVEQAYAKSILFDYGYRYFYEDGYGKDYRIFNLPRDYDAHHNHYLTAALVTFYQQQRLYEERKTDFRPYNLTAPLWVFVGASVIKDDGSKETAANYKERASDVANVLRFLAWFTAERQQAVAAIDAVVFGSAASAGLVDKEGRDIFSGTFPFLKEQQLDARILYQDILARVFRNSAGGSLVVDRITGDSGELLLKIGETETPFGLINVGDAPGLAEHLQDANIPHVIVQKAELASPLFADISTDASPVNILIGSKKFIEGWNCWRVSSMGLMNTGKKEGSQIIQLFGRGVRLKGRNMSLMRTSKLEPAVAPKLIHLLETLNVFGVGADFMATFRDFLNEEGLPGNDDPQVFSLKLNVTHDLGKQLKMLRPKVRKDTQQVYSFPRHGPLIRFGGWGTELGLPPDIIEKGRKILLDKYPRLDTIQADGVAVNQVHQPEIHDDGRCLSAAHRAFLDWNRLYLDLALYVKNKGYANLLIDPVRLPALLDSDSWYLLQMPGNLWAMQAHNFRFWQQVALELLCSLADRVFNYHKRAYLEPRLELVKLEEAAGNLPDQDEYRIIVDGSESVLIEDIKALKQAFEQGQDEFIPERETLAGTQLDIHLYNPLLTARSNRIKIEPVVLNDGEYKFVQDMKAWLLPRMADMHARGEQLYLLRNQVRGGIGFFEAGGFYPDFILWQVIGKKQTILFIDPHGLIHTGIGDEKIQFYKTIKDVERRLKDDEIRLESAILSPSKTIKPKIMKDWNMTADALAGHHVFFMSDTEYLDDLYRIIADQ